MLENIAVSVSTVIFLLCSFIISSVLPDKGDAGSPPSEPLRGESVSMTESAGISDSARIIDSAGISDSANTNTADALPVASLTDEFSIEGVWECFGHRYEFKSDGRLIAEGETLRWQLSNGEMVINYDGKPHIVTFEPLGERVMRLDGKTFYRISGS